MAADGELPNPKQYKNYSEFLVYGKRRPGLGIKSRSFGTRPQDRSRDSAYYNFKRWLEMGRGTEGFQEVQGLTLVDLYTNGITKTLLDRSPYSSEHFCNILNTVDQNVNTRFIYIRPNIEHDTAVAVCDTIGTIFALEADFLWSIFGKKAGAHLKKRNLWDEHSDEHLWLPLLAPDPTFLRFGDLHAKSLPSFHLGRDKLNIG